MYVVIIRINWFCSVLPLAILTSELAWFKLNRISTDFLPDKIPRLALILELDRRILGTVIGEISRHSIRIIRTRSESPYYSIGGTREEIRRISRNFTDTVHQCPDKPYRRLLPNWYQSGRISLIHRVVGHIPVQVDAAGETDGVSG